MNRTTSSISTATLLVLFTSCGGEDGLKTGGAQNGSSADSPDHSQETDSGSPLRLDGTVKWKANEATHIGMANMKKLVTEFEASATKNYEALGKSLRAEASDIISKCDMMGEPHDQLHLVLNPMLEAIKKLESGDGGSEECRALQQLLQDYDAHFGL